MATSPVCWAGCGSASTVRARVIQRPDWWRSPPVLHCRTVRWFTRYGGSTASYTESSGNKAPRARKGVAMPPNIATPSCLCLREEQGTTAPLPGHLLAARRWRAGDLDTTGHRDRHFHFLGDLLPGGYLHLA